MDYPVASIAFLAVWNLIPRHWKERRKLAIGSQTQHFSLFSLVVYIRTIVRSSKRLEKRFPVKTRGIGRWTLALGCHKEVLLSVKTLCSRKRIKPV